MGFFERRIIFACKRRKAAEPTPGAEDENRVPRGAMDEEIAVN